MKVNPLAAGGLLRGIKSMSVYVLQDCYGAVYVGISHNVGKRVEQHTSGASPFTRMNYDFKTLEVIHEWKAPCYSLASRLERYLNASKKKVVLNLIWECPLWGRGVHDMAVSMPITLYESNADAGFFGDIKKSPLTLPNSDLKSRYEFHQPC